MANLPESWTAYRRLQTKLSHRIQLDDYTWGLEAGLNSIADSPTSSFAIDCRRTVASAARKARDHSARFLSRASDDADIEDLRDFNNQIEASDLLVKISKLLPPMDIKLLNDLGDGYSYKEMAGRHGGTAASLRVRALRLRQAIKHRYI